jgi:hypothetical protein
MKMDPALGGQTLRIQAEKKILIAFTAVETFIVNDINLELAIEARLIEIIIKIL